MKLPILATYLPAMGQGLFLVVTVVSGGLLTALWVATIIYFPIQDPAAVLHYSIDVGIDFVGEGRQITTLPIIGTLMSGFNLIMGLALLRADQRASWILWSIMPVIPAILLGAVVLLWRINVS